MVRPSLVPSFLVIWGRFVERYRAKRAQSGTMGLADKAQPLLSVSTASPVKTGFSLSPYCPYDGDEASIVS